MFHEEKSGFCFVFATPLILKTRSMNIHVYNIPIKLNCGFLLEDIYYEYTLCELNITVTFLKNVNSKATKKWWWRSLWLRRNYYTQKLGDIVSNEFHIKWISAPRIIEKIKIPGAVLELPAKQHRQFGQSGTFFK